MAKAKPVKKFEPKVLIVPTKKVKPYLKNAKKHSDEQIESLATQIHKHGFTQPILVDKKMVIVAGHGRLLAANFLGLQEVPVIVCDHLSDTQIRKVRLADNKVVSTEYDKDFEAFELAALEREGVDLDDIGYDPDEIGKLLKWSEDEVVREDNQKRSGSSSKIDYDPKTITLIVDPEHYERILGDLSRLQKTFGVGTNVDVIQKLIVYYDSGGVFNGEH